MKRYFFVLIFLSFSASVFAGIGDPLSYAGQVTPITNEKARGDEVVLTKGILTPHIVKGGLGDMISGWNATFEIRSSVGAEHVFVHDLLRSPGKGPNTLQNVAVETLGEGTYRITVPCPGPSTYEIEIISPATFIEVPDLNHPVPGWVGPRYGVTGIQFISK